MPIRKPIRDIGRQTALYGLGNALTKLAAFFLIPVYTRYLSMSEVGILALLEMAELFVLTLSPLGIVNAVWRFLPGEKEKDQNEIIFTGYAGILGINVIILGLLSLNYSSLSGFFGLQEADARILLIVLMNILFSVGIRYTLYLWQYQKRAFSYVVLSTVQFAGILLVTIILVVWRGYGLWGVLIARAIVLGSIFVFTAFITLSNYTVRPSANVLTKLLKYGLPLTLLAVVTPVLTVSDRFFMKVLHITLDDIGVYSIAYKFGMLINMFLVVPLQRGWGPMMYRLGIDEESHVFYRDIMFYYAVVGSLFFLVISFFARDILSVVATEAYVRGSFVVPIITSAYLINGFRQFFVAGAALKDRTPRLAGAAVLAVLLNLGSNYVLIRHYGIPGAAWATLLSYTGLVFFVYVASRKLVGIDWGWGRLVNLAAVLLVVFFATGYVQSRVNQLDAFLNLSGIVAFVLLLWVTRIVGYREISGIRTVMSMMKIRR